MQSVSTKGRWIRLTIGIIFVFGLLYLYLTRKEGLPLESKEPQVQEIEVVQVDREEEPPVQNEEPAPSKPAAIEEGSDGQEVLKKPSFTLKKTGDPDVDRTLHLIFSGGPFPYPEKDGSVFRNYEKHLPQKPNGFYHEYTVPTPGLRHRGARRIVTGGTPPTLFYYTTDHYNTFKKLEVVQ